MEKKLKKLSLFFDKKKANFKNQRYLEPLDFFLISNPMIRFNFIEDIKSQTAI